MSVERDDYLKEFVFPSIAKLGRFGLGSKFIRYKDNKNNKTSVQFASSIVFCEVIVQNCVEGEEREERTFKLVVKFLPASMKVREMMNSIVQFHNENVMYSVILPFLEYNDIVSQLFPKFYYGDCSEEKGKLPVVIVEDLNEKKFKISKFKLFLDFNHIIVALKALGKFHALSYIAKQTNPDAFDEIKNKLQEHAWTEERNKTPSMIGLWALRGVIPLHDVKKSEILEKLIGKLKTDSFGLMKYFITPNEDTAVICHGDFCNHNVLFKYSGNDPEIPTNIKFFDLQNSRYASPVIDLSMILYLNTEYELRSKHWDEFLSIYYNAVKETVESANCTPPSYCQLVNEFRTKSFYGYCNCSYFLPMMMSEETPPDLDEFADKDPEELLQAVLQIGGEKGTQGLMSIVKQLDELDYFGFLS